MGPSARSDYAANDRVFKTTYGANWGKLPKPATLADGLSNTILFGEKAMSPIAYGEGSSHWDEPIIMGGTGGTGRCGRLHVVLGRLWRALNFRNWSHRLDYGAGSTRLWDCFDSNAPDRKFNLRITSMESIYWVLSRDCNQRCPHCYTEPEPGAPGLTFDEVTRCIANLPDPGEVPVARVILSGGEVLVWPELLFHALSEFHARFQGAVAAWVQTNGDLLDEAMLQRLLDAHVKRIDISSMDKYHMKSTAKRRSYLEGLFKSFGLVTADCKSDPAWGTAGNVAVESSFWGATEDKWIGPLWPRGHANQKGLSKSTIAFVATGAEQRVSWIITNRDVK